MTESQQVEASNKKLAAGLTGIFLGAFGVHKFVLGYNRPAIIMLMGSLVGGLVTCGIASFVIGLIDLIEGINYLTKSPSEFQAQYIDATREWF